MKITLESTTDIVTIDVPGGGSYQARVWSGATEKGVPVLAIIPRLATIGPHTGEFDADLKASSIPVPVIFTGAFSARMVLP